MLSQQKIHTLVVDDSMLFRELLRTELEKDSGILVVGTAADSRTARDRIFALRPQVVVLDVEMPGMNGIEFLSKLLPEYPIPVVVISAKPDYVFPALAAGAVDFVEKPSATAGETGFERFIKELALKIKIASISKVGNLNSVLEGRRPPCELLGEGPSAGTDIIVAIGASTGGTEAIHAILKDLPADFPPVLIAQHMPPVFTRLFAQRLDEASAIQVKEADNGEEITCGKALVAPGDMHLKLSVSNGRYIAKCGGGDMVNGHRPSVDVLFESVAEAAGDKAIGVILTGMGVDGARGLCSMRARGAFTIGQDEESSVVYGMPKVAYDMGAVEKKAPLSEIAEILVSEVVKRRRENKG